MSNKIVLDSCVFSKQFLEESDSYQANALIERLITNKVDILVPSLFVYEVLATVNIGNYPVNEVYELIADFQKTQLHTIELDGKHIAKRWKFVKQAILSQAFLHFMTLVIMLWLLFIIANLSQRIKSIFTKHST